MKTIFVFQLFSLFFNIFIYNSCLYTSCISYSVFWSDPDFQTDMSMNMILSNSRCVNWKKLLTGHFARPRSLDRNHIVNYYVKWDKIFWTYSTVCFWICFQFLLNNQSPPIRNNIKLDTYSESPSTRKNLQSIGRFLNYAIMFISERMKTIFVLQLFSLFFNIGFIYKIMYVY